MLSACWLIGAYFLAVSSHKCGPLYHGTSVYGTKLQVAWVAREWKKNTVASTAMCCYRPLAFLSDSQPEMPRSGIGTIGGHKPKTYYFRETP